MALVRDAEPASGPSRWLPTHVQVTVLRARGLRGKSSGAGSTSDAYTVIQVGREKYSTSVVEKTQGCPEWCEECSFELPPGALDGLLRAQEPDAGPAPWAAGAAAACELVLTTMHRSLIGVDKFLGRATVALDEVFREGRSQHTQWYELHSKPGKKDKERGQIQVTIQFTRNNLSASMFDLSAKEKPRSPFSKLKDKVKGKKRFELESASAILPSSALEDPELGSLGKMGKAKGFFLRHKLRRSSLSQSNTSLGSDSTLSSASGSLGCQGPGAELVARSPSHSSWLSTEAGRDATQSPRLLAHKRTYSDEASQVRAAASRALLELQGHAGHLDAASRSSLCVNGSHVYNEEPQLSSRPRGSISGPVQPSGSGSLHSIPARRPSEEGPRSSDESGGRGTSSSEVLPGQEEPSAQAKALAPGVGRAGEEEVRPPEGRPVQVAVPIMASADAVEKEGSRKEERKPRMGLFHHHHQGLSRSESGRRGSVGEKGSPSRGASSQRSPSGEDKARSSWFGLREPKEPAPKPSLDVSPQVESDPAAPPCSPRAPAPPTPAPAAAPMLSTNLFAAVAPAAAAATTVPAAPLPGFRGASNPFLTSLQSNPFLEELVADAALNCPSPAPCLPRASRASPAPLASPGKAPPEWDNSFNVFAASRLPPEARREGLALAGVGLQELGPGGAAVKAAEPQGDPGGGRGGSSVCLEPRAPEDSGLDQPSSSASDPGPLRSAQFHPRTSASTPDREPAAAEAGQSPADSGASQFSSPEVLSVGDTLPGEDGQGPEGQDGETPRSGSQLGSELNAADEANDPWPWDMVAVSPAAEAASPGPLAECEEERPEPPDVFHPEGSDRPSSPLASELEGWDEGLWSGTPPPKPPRLFTSSNSQVEDEEEEDEEVEKAGGGLSDRGEGAEDPRQSVLPTGPQESEEEGVNPQPEQGPHPSAGPLRGEPDRKERGSDGAPQMGACPLGPTSRPEGPASRPRNSKSGQAVWGAPQTEGLETQSWGSEKPLSGTPQHADPWALEEESLNPFLRQESRDPPSFPSTSPPGSRESSICSGQDELPTPPEPAFPPPPLPPWAGHSHGVPSPPCPLLSRAWPLTPSSPPPGEPASPTGGSLTPHGEDHTAATPASPLVLLPLETRPAEEPPPSVSPHLVKPLSAAPVEGSPDRKQPRSSLSSALSSGLERLKTAASSGVQPAVTADTKKLKDAAGLDQSAKYYHLTHDELIGLLLQRERELSQREEHVGELERYIDRLLVRIMEASPALLQIPPGTPK